MTKRADRRAVALGHSVRYTISVHNAGHGAATSVRLADTFDHPVSVTHVTGARCHTGPPVRCTIGRLRAGHTATVTVTARPHAPGTVTNTAAATGRSARRVLHAQARYRERVSIARGRLHLSKTVATHQVRGGHALRYRLSAWSTGPVLHDAWVCDALPRSLAVIHAPGAHFEHGRPCWRMATMRAGHRMHVTLTVRTFAPIRAETVRNTVVGGAANAPRARASAPAVRVVPARPARGGGVTG